MKILRGDRNRLYELREKFLERRRVGVYCAIALISKTPSLASGAANSVTRFAEYFRNEMVPFISGSSVFSFPDPKDPVGNESLHIAESDAHLEMLFTDGTYRTLTWYSELADVPPEPARCRR